VHTWEKAADNRKYICDIFDAEGRFVSKIPLNPSSDIFYPASQIFKRGKLYSIEEDTGGYSVVKRYQVTWKS
jgi:hypothetical protein